MITIYNGEYIIEHDSTELGGDLTKESMDLLNDFDIEQFLKEHYKGKVKLYKIVRVVEEIEI